MAKTLKPYAVNSILSTARQMFNGTKQRKTVVVEGVNDVRFFNQWYGDSNIVRFVAAEGKSNVITVHAEYVKQQNLKNKKAMFFCVDIDWDLLHRLPPPNSDDFMCNSYCLSSSTHYHNDLEGFLVNTGALKKVLSSYDIDMSNGQLAYLSNEMEKASRCVGKYRAADHIVQKSLGLKNSVLNGLDISVFFDASNFSIDEKKLLDAMPRWSNYPYHIDDLVDEASTLNKNHSRKWELSNGHDITEMLALHLEYKTKTKGIVKEKIERELRLGCELSDFILTPMFAKMNAESLIQ